MSAKGHEMAREIQRAVSIATIRPSKAGFHPVISHMYGEEVALHACETQAEAQQYVDSIWAGVRWLTPAGFKAAMRERAA